MSDDITGPFYTTSVDITFIGLLWRWTLEKSHGSSRLFDVPWPPVLNILWATCELMKWKDRLPKPQWSVIKYKMCTLVVIFHICSCDKHKPFFYWTIVAQERWGCKENQDKLYASLLGKHTDVIVEYNVRELGTSSAKIQSPARSGVLFKASALIAGCLPGFLTFPCLHDRSGMVVLFVVLNTMCASLYISMHFSKPFL